MKTSKSVRAYLAQIGRKGGSAGTGPAKRRGDSKHYRELAERARNRQERGAIAKA